MGIPKNTNLTTCLPPQRRPPSPRHPLPTQVLRDDRCCHHLPQGPHWILPPGHPKYICANYKVDAAKAAVQVHLALKRGVAKGALKMARASGKGAGSYKVVKAEKPKKVKKAKKPKAKKPEKVKKAKKPAAEKAKKPKKAAKKPAAKKAAKKPAAKKAAKKKK